MNRLTPILESRRAAVAAAIRQRPLDMLNDAIARLPAPRDFHAALAAPGLSVIAEIKRRSPSLGAIKGGAHAGETARLYRSAGAAAISVLTEPDHFDGCIDDLVAARAAQSAPVLRKDFIVDAYQIAELRAVGADAVLLIVAALGARTAEFLAEADAHGLAALVEVHDEDELDVALDAGARLLGINNRNLADLGVDLATFERIAPLVPAGIVRVAESGVETHADAARMRRAGADAILVGTSLMRAADPAAALSALLG